MLMCGSYTAPEKGGRVAALDRWTGRYIHIRVDLRYGLTLTPEYLATAVAKIERATANGMYSCSTNAVSYQVQRLPPKPNPRSPVGKVGSLRSFRSQERAHKHTHTRTHTSERERAA